MHFQPLTTFRWFQEHAALLPGGTPVADALAPRVLSLPLHTRLSDDDVDRVAELLVKALP